jgi:hypothetical protein
MITDQQFQKLMKEHNKSGVLSHSAMKAGMDPKTARRFIRAGKGPQEMKSAHTWRTRTDPVKAIWVGAQLWLADSPELEAKMLFEYLVTEQAAKTGEPIDTQGGRALRTFQRRVQQWRHKHGPDKEVCFEQVHKPGQWMQFDWTNANELAVTINGVAYPHLLAQSVLPFSNWQWAVPCQSESVLSLKLGVQEGFWHLGGLTKGVQTDQSSTATHQLQRGKSERGFNAEYLAMCAHLNVEPRTIAVRCPNQNGDVEAAQHHIKRRLNQHLLLRRSRDFSSAAEYAAFVAKVCTAANALRTAKIAQETACLRALPPTRFPQAEESTSRVSSGSTIRVKNCAYSVPTRLIGAMVQTQASEAEVTIRYLNETVATYPRSHSQQPRIDYRHVIDCLLRKPGAFANYLYREELFPKAVFRQTYDRLKTADESKAGTRYLHVLKLAAQYGEDRVSDLLGQTLRQGELPDARTMEPLLTGPIEVPVVQLPAFIPDLAVYDLLMAEPFGYPQDTALIAEVAS